MPTALGSLFCEPGQLTAKKRFRHSDLVTVNLSQSEGLGKMAPGIVKYAYDRSSQSIGVIWFAVSLSRTPFLECLHPLRKMHVCEGLRREKRTSSRCSVSFRNNAKTRIRKTTVNGATGVTTLFTTLPRATEDSNETCGLRGKLPPASMATTHGGNYLLTLSMLTISRKAVNTDF